MQSAQGRNEEHSGPQLKIVIIQGAFLPVPPVMGGACEKMWHALAQKFAARGHTVLHISRKWPTFPDREEIQGVHHLRVTGYSTPSKLLTLKILDAIYTVRTIRAIPMDADIVVTNTFWAPVIIPLFRRAKVYVDVARMPKGQMKFYRNAARLRANSTPVANAILAELPEVRHSRVAMIPNPLPDEATKPVNWAIKECSILYCGRVHPEKGLELLAMLAKVLPAGWKISIVGPWKTAEGGGGDAYLSSLKTLFEPNRVDFIGPIYEMEKLNLWYEKAAIFVYPSVAEKGETFGLAPLEAMAWGGVPVVSDLQCFKDFIVDGVNGRIFNHRVTDAQTQLMDCALSLINNGELRRTLGTSASKVRQTHSPISVADLFLADFARLTENAV